MSRTTRHVQPGWGPGHSKFDTWNAERPEQERCKSVNDQIRDRPSLGKQGGKFGRFINRVKNCRYNLIRKTDPTTDDNA